MRILVVDHDSNWLKEWSREARKRGFIAAGVDHGLGAAELAGRFRAEGIVLDLDLTDVDSRDVLSAIHRSPETQGVPVLATCHHADQIVRDTALSLGARDVVEKPVPLEMLIRRLSHWAGYERRRTA